MFLSLLAEASTTLHATYPGGASLNDPVPTNIEAYGNAWTYGLIGLVVLFGTLFAVTRLNVDR